VCERERERERERGEENVIVCMHMSEGVSESIQDSSLLKYLQGYLLCNSQGDPEHVLSCNKCKHLNIQH
jgi:hypothetical protein